MSLVSNRHRSNSVALCWSNYKNQIPDKLLRTKSHNAVKCNLKERYLKVLETSNYLKLCFQSWSAFHLKDEKLLFLRFIFTKFIHTYGFTFLDSQCIYKQFDGCIPCLITYLLTYKKLLKPPKIHLNVAFSDTAI